MIHMTRILALVPLLAMSSLVVAKEPVQTARLNITIRAPKDSYILGEPIVFAAVWENIGPPLEIAFGTIPNSPATDLIIKGPTTQECDPHRARGNPALGSYTTLDGKEKRPLGLPGVVNEGAYEVFIVYDTAKLDQWYEQLGIERLRVESNHVRFHIDRPQGVDAQVFLKYRVPRTFSNGVWSGRCNEMAVTERALDEFPTSTYVAYALWNQARPGYIAGIDPPDYPVEKEFMAMEQERASGTSTRDAFDRFWTAERRLLAPLERLYRDFPDFTYRAEVLYTLVRTYFRLSEPDKAVPILKELFEKHPSSDAAVKAQAYKQVLQEHDIWPSPSTPAAQGN